MSSSKNWVDVHAEYRQQHQEHIAHAREEMNLLKHLADLDLMFHRLVRLSLSLSLSLSPSLSISLSLLPFYPTPLYLSLSLSLYIYIYLLSSPSFTHPLTHLTLTLFLPPLLPPFSQPTSTLHRFVRFAVSLVG